MRKSILMALVRVGGAWVVRESLPDFKRYLRLRNM